LEQKRAERASGGSLLCYTSWRIDTSHPLFSRGQHPNAWASGNVEQSQSRPEQIGCPGLALPLRSPDDERPRSSLPNQGCGVSQICIVRHPVGFSIDKRKTKSYDHRIIIRAYALGYLTTTTPRLLSFVRILLKQEVSNRDKVRLVRHIISYHTWLA
jgi:hypothetical protein